ncbi:MAG: hypothetical protein B6U94_02765 [Thermofilum sp. ex4484_79]|nr:MAG: hypothetical protein B6U94_02765 [Thermofilum sp. ex4484_79]
MRILKQEDFFIVTHGPTKLFDITERVAEIAKDIDIGLVNVFSKGSTGGLVVLPRDSNTIENYEKDLWKLIPIYGWRHPGNAYAHLRSSLIGTSINVIVEKGKLLLPPRNGIFFLENQFTNARRRHILVTIIVE